MKSRPCSPRLARAWRGAVLLVCGLFVARAATAQAPEANVTGGRIRGEELAGGGAVFRGIPFARPPVGGLRWREPMPVQPWTGVRDATKSGPPAAQAAFGWNDTAAAASREDCLYLDVWTPKLAAHAKLPVMVWFHGGGNVAGAGGFDPVYRGQSLIRHGVVLVIVEYRLGVFGFMAHPELTRESPHHASGNYAILDQLASLRWVRDNIARFGGDPGKVTIFGQSAGSMDVIALMSTPLGRGLFQGAIAESGAPGTRMSVALPEAERAGTTVAEKLQAPKDGALAFLRSLPAADILRVGREVGGFTVDGWVFTEPTTVTWAAGREAPVPLLIGSAAIEFAADGGIDGVRRAIRETFGDAAPKALALYGLEGATPPPADPVYGDVPEQWGSDVFRCPAVLHGEKHASAGHPVWEYQFDRPIPPHPKVGHSGDLPYVFGNFDLKTGNLVGEYGEADRRLSETIQRYWTNFAKHGDPNGAGVPGWPGFDAQTRRYLDFTADARIAVAANQRGAFCDLFRAGFWPVVAK